MTGFKVVRWADPEEVAERYFMCDVCRRGKGGAGVVMLREAGRLLYNIDFCEHCWRRAQDPEHTAVSTVLRRPDLYHEVQEPTFELMLRCWLAEREGAAP